jgi:hypothetical protein
MNEAELAGRTAQLPEIFADRLPAADLRPLRSMAGGGEWDELLGLLLVALRETQAPVTMSERDQLREVLTGWGLATDPLDDLLVIQ